MGTSQLMLFGAMAAASCCARTCSWKPASLPHLPRPQVLEHAGVSSHFRSTMFTAAVGASKLAGVALSFLLIDSLGRRPLLVWGSAGCALALGGLVAADWLDAHAAVSGWEGPCGRRPQRPAAPPVLPCQLGCVLCAAVGPPLPRPPPAIPRPSSPVHREDRCLAIAPTAIPCAGGGRHVHLHLLLLSLLGGSLLGAPQRKWVLISLNGCCSASVGAAQRERGCTACLIDCALCSCMVSAQPVISLLAVLVLGGCTVAHCCSYWSSLSLPPPFLLRPQELSSLTATSSAASSATLLRPLLHCPALPARRNSSP